MKEMRATIQNEHGIHCRPSALIVKEARDYPGTIRVVAESGESDLQSVVGLLTMGLSCGTEIVVQVDGANEDAMCARLVTLFETRFDFPLQESGEAATTPATGLF